MFYVFSLQAKFHLAFPQVVPKILVSSLGAVEIYLNPKLTCHYTLLNNEKWKIFSLSFAGRGCPMLSILHSVHYWCSKAFSRTKPWLEGWGRGNKKVIDFENRLYTFIPSFISCSSVVFALAGGKKSILFLGKSFWVTLVRFVYKVFRLSEQTGREIFECWHS